MQFCAKCDTKHICQLKHFFSLQNHLSNLVNSETAVTGFQPKNVIFDKLFSNWDVAPKKNKFYYFDKITNNEANNNESN